MRSLSLAIGCLAATIAGCGTPSGNRLTIEDMPTLALNDVGELYRLYTAEKKKPPTKTADLVPLESINPTGLHAIESGDVVVRFGAPLLGTLEGISDDDSADEVLAFAKDVPESGGPVLMLNRSIRTMTADEFKAAKLAGTSSSTPTPVKRKSGRERGQKGKGTSLIVMGVWKGKEGKGDITNCYGCLGKIVKGLDQANANADGLGVGVGVGDCRSNRVAERYRWSTFRTRRGDREGSKAAPIRLRLRSWEC